MAHIVSYKAQIAGERLMMHNEQLANPFNEYTQELKRVTAKRQKSLEEHKEIARIEFQGGLYFDDKAGPFVPAHCLNKMLVEGAKRRKLGSAFARMVMVDREINPVLYAGPRTREALWSSNKFVDQRLVGVGMARTLRTRPLFVNWSVEFVIRVLDGAVNESDVKAALVAAEQIGLLDGRPVYAGQFRTESFDLLTDKETTKRNGKAVEVTA